jgi:hypothetical protein
VRTVSPEHINDSIIGQLVLELVDVEDTTPEELNGILQAMCLKNKPNGLLFYACTDTFKILRSRKKDITKVTRKLLQAAGADFGHRNKWLTHALWEKEP